MIHLVARHQTHVRSLDHGYDGPRWSDPYHCEWSTVVGNRIRRLRRERGLALHELARGVHKPEGGHYSAGYFSRLERGWASAPLYVYLAIADVLGVQPGRLLGPDDAQRAIGEGELVLIRFLRRLAIEPDEVVARLAAAAPAGQEPP